MLVGVGFYPAAILLAILSASCMMWMSTIEGTLPSHEAIAVTLRFRQGVRVEAERLRAAARERGYAIAEGSLVISGSDGEVEWRFVAVSLGRSRAASLTELAEELAHFEGVASFSVSRARN